MLGSSQARRSRLALSRLEDRTLLSSGFDARTFVGPLQHWNPEQSISAVADVRLPVSGDQIAAEPAFDSFGRALPENKSRIDSDLLRLFNAWQDQGPNWSTRGIQAGNDLQVDEQGNVEVHITVRDNAALKPSLESVGFHILYDLPAQHLIEGFLPIEGLRFLDGLSARGLMGVQPTYKPHTSVGLVTSQGDWTMSANRLRDQTPYTGAGQRIGVVSDSYNRLANPITTAAQDIANDDLPAGGVQVLQEGPANSSDEGRAMLQIIHDTAPGAALAFSSGFVGGEPGFAAAIENLADPAQGNCKTIVDDLGYYEEPMFQDGLVAQAVSDVVSTHGVAYFTAAANSADDSYESPRYAEGPDSEGVFTGNWYDFNLSGANDSRMRITVPTGKYAKIVLQWDQPFFTPNFVTTDLDLWLVRADTGQIVAWSADTNLSTQIPSEFISYQNTTGQTEFDLMVQRYIGTQPNRFKIVFDTGIAAIQINEYDTHSPTVTPHAVLTACGVGAYSYYNQRYAEPYSSLGPLVSLFDAAGNRYATPHVIQQPRIVAPDKVNTSFFVDDIDSDHDNYPNFPGTSAAAPHAAAVAALIRQANPTFTPLQILGRMEVFADNTINGPGNDPLTGSGKLDAFRAIKGDQIAAEPDFSDGFESAYLGQSWETYARDAGRVAVSNNTFPQSGAWHLRMGSESGVDQTPNYILHSLSEAILHVNAAGANNLELSFYARTFGTGINGYLPVGLDYTGHTENSGVSFSVDGINWHAIVNFSGLGSTYQNYTVDLVEAAALEGVTLTSDTQIRFAAVASNGFPTNGLGLDSVNVTRHGKLSGHIINDLNGDSFNTGEPGIPGRRAYHDLDRDGVFDRTSQTFNSSGGPVAIPDFSGGPSTVTSPIVVSGTNGPLLDLEVAVDINHTFTSDLTLFLNGPGGQRVQLFNRHGLNSDNLSGTIFDDQALTPVSTGYGPFATRYRPYATFNPFLGLSGSSVNGTWTLEIHDNATGDVGTLNSWSLILKTAAKYTNNNSVSIPDYYSTGSITTFAGPSTARSYATISGLIGPVNHVTVGININHTYDGDLTAFLVSPSGVRVQLLDRFGLSGNSFA